MEKLSESEVRAAARQDFFTFVTFGIFIEIGINTFFFFYNNKTYFFY